MKKLTASIVAGALMISAMGINAFAEETAAPKIKVYGNSVATAKDNTVNLNVRMSNFAGVAGMDLTIEGTGVTLGAPASSDITLEEGSNYKREGNKLHIVELNAKNDDTLNIKIPATVSGDEAGTITVTSSKLAADGKKLLTAKTEYSVDNDNGSVAVTPADKTATKNIKDTDKTFIPFGSVFKDRIVSDANRITKDGNGEFTIDGTASYKEFTVPENGILTFGVGTKADAAENEPNVQFGTYTKNTGKKYGTMLIVGNWQGYIDYKIKTKGMTAAEAIKEMYGLAKVEGKDYAKAQYEIEGGATKAVYIYKTEQSKYMWKSADGGFFEYALRVIGPDGYTCTAVGYHADEDGSNPVFSNQLKSKTLATK